MGWREWKGESGTTLELQESSRGRATWLEVALRDDRYPAVVTRSSFLPPSPTYLSEILLLEVGWRWREEGGTTRDLPGRSRCGRAKADRSTTQHTKHKQHLNNLRIA
jgi:hypothetical protein